jgi:tetratricopeptide (TPR) repeat protein
MSEDRTAGSEERAPEQTCTAKARALGQQNDWQGAFELLASADARGELVASGLEFAAECARWAGKNELVVDLLERSHRAYVAKVDQPGTVRTALLLCYTHMDSGEKSLAGSWWQRADAMILDVPEGPEHALHAWFAGRACGEQGDLEAQRTFAQKALEISLRHGDRNVEALALIDLALVATHRGQSSEALALLDRATALALGGELGVLESGIVFCNAIIACRSRGEWDRAVQWTNSANRWVARVQVSYFPGLCRVHRSEVLRVRGELAAAESEAQEAVRLLAAGIPRWVSMAHTELGEIRRRRGDLEGAADAFRSAREKGWDPQPALAQLLLDQGDGISAHRSLERYCRSDVSTLISCDRANLLRVQVSAAIAAQEWGVAEQAARDLEVLAGDDSLAWDRAVCAQAQGELALAQGDLARAVDQLQVARTIWGTLDVPYELASSSFLLGKALAAEEDRHGAALEFEAALGIYDRLGAGRDRDRVAKELALFVESSARKGACPHTVQLGQQAAAAGGEASLCREADFWTWDFEGRVLRVQDSRGVSYLALLLGEPGRDRLALDLASGGPAPLQQDAGEGVLDAEARASYRRRIEELREDLDEAERHDDLGRTEKLRAELDTLTQELTAALGLGGRSRRLDPTQERARQSVTKAIRTAIRKLGDEHESLGRYLSNTIRTGTVCRFDPDPGRPVNWRIQATS